MAHQMLAMATSSEHRYVQRAAAATVAAMAVHDLPAGRWPALLDSVVSEFDVPHLSLLAVILEQCEVCACVRVCVWTHVLMSGPLDLVGSRVLP